MTIAALILLLAVQGQAKSAKPTPKPAPAAAKPTAKPAAAKAAAEAPLPPSPWTLRENQDASKGVRYASASMTGAAGYRIAVRCDMSPDPVVSVQFIPPKSFNTQTEKLVTILPDNAGALVVNWEFVGSGAINRSVDVFRIVQLIGAAKSLRVFTTDGAGDPVSDGFEGPGGDAIFRHVFDFCSTPYAPMTAVAAPAPPAPPAPPPAPAPILKLSPTQKTPGIKPPPVSSTPAPAPQGTPQ